jgi:hypothetical protein
MRIGVIVLLFLKRWLFSFSETDVVASGVSSGRKSCSTGCLAFEFPSDLRERHGSNRIRLANGAADGGPKLSRLGGPVACCVPATVFYKDRGPAVCPIALFTA